MTKNNKKDSILDLGYSKEQVDLLIEILNKNTNIDNNMIISGYIGSLPASKEVKKLLKQIKNES